MVVLDDEVLFDQRQELVVAAAGFVAYLNTRSGCGSDPLQGANPIVGVDLGAAAAHDLGNGGVRPDDGDLAQGAGIERQDPIVLEQDDAFRAGPPDERSMLRAVDRLLVDKGGISNPPTQAIRRSMRRALSRTAATLTWPASTASSSFSPLCLAGPGILRSRPLAAQPTVLCEPNQSDITAPSKPHSCLSKSVSRPRCSLVLVPLTLL